MKEITIPIDVKIRIKKMPIMKSISVGKITMTAKTTPLFILFFYVAARVFFLGIKAMINGG